VTDENSFNLADMLAPRRGLNTSAPIEIITPAFRGVAQNFFSLPTYLFLELKTAQNNKTGDELLILYDAAEQAFTDKDMDRLEDLALTDFITVMDAWVNASGTSAVQ
jgi:hypothetical protein